MKLEIQHSETNNIYWLGDEDTGQYVCDFYYETDDDDFHRFDNAEQNAKDIAQRYNAHEDLLSALEETRRLVCECSKSGFVDGTWLHKLFENNGMITAAIKKAKGDK